MADLFDRFEPLLNRKNDLLGDEGPDPFQVEMDEVISQTEAIVKGKKIILAGTNNYLGLTFAPEALKAAHEALELAGTGTTGSRVANGTYHGHTKLEETLGKFLGKKHAMVFSTGYLANLGVLSTLLGPDDYILMDADCHASIYDGVRMGQAQIIRFRHNDPEDLRNKLSSLPIDAPKIVAFESVYSMDGDIAPIDEICEVAKEFGAMTYLDEVHAVGLYGKSGGGISEQEDVAHKVDLIEGTLGKAYGVVGGYITGSNALCDFIRSFSSGFIFTTALPPAIVAGALSSVKHLKTSQIERANQKNKVAYLRSKLDSMGIPHLMNPSHIVPVMIKDSVKCKQISDILLNDYSIYVQPINYPTVPKGTERLRFTPSPLHTYDDIDYLVNSLASLWKQCALSRVVA